MPTSSSIHLASYTGPFARGALYPLCAHEHNYLQKISCAHAYDYFYSDIYIAVALVPFLLPTNQYESRLTPTEVGLSSKCK